MRKCNKCNSVTDDNEVYCPNCGNKMITGTNISLILAIIAVVFVIIGVNIIFNIISIILSIVSIVLGIVKYNKNKWSIGLSIFSILGSAIWILFNFIN